MSPPFCIATSSVEAPAADPPVVMTAMQAVDAAWRQQYADPHRARDAALHAADVASALGDRGALAHAHFQRAYAAIRLNQPAEANVALSAARALFEAGQDARGIWLVGVGEALCARIAGRVEGAIECLLALSAAPPPGVTVADLFIVHVALSLAYRYVGLLEPALKWHYQAVDTAKNSADPILIASTLCNLGGYHSDLHNQNEACRMLEEGLALARANDADRTTAILALNLTQCYVQLGRHGDALALAETYLTDERYARAMGGPDPCLRLSLALAYTYNQRPDDAEREFARVRPLLVKTGHVDGTPEVFWAFVEARIAMVAGRPRHAADVALATLAQLEESAVDSPFDLMQLHATAAEACEAIGDHRRALMHERRRAVIRERLAKLAAHVASLTHKIRHELDDTRAERDRVVVLHAELEREHARLAALNAALTAQIAENLRLQDELQEQSYRDALTELHNRRYFYERGPRLLAASIAQATPLSLVMLDLDDFKRLNDAYGHTVGDKALAAVGKLLRAGVRESDVVCRVGGEEFAMLLPTSTAAAATVRLEAMLAACRSVVANDIGQEAAGLTFSAGVVQAPEHGTTIDELMIAADRLLYSAKRKGRARIEVADPDCTRDDTDRVA